MLEYTKYLCAGLTGFVAFHLLIGVFDQNMSETPRYSPPAESQPVAADPPATPRGDMPRSIQTLADEKMAQAPNERARARIASGVFLGFWMLQGRGRTELCNEVGVDLTSFQMRFEAANTDLYKKAAVLAREDGIELEYLYSIQREAIMDRLSYEMLYLDGPPTDLKEACDRFLRDATTHLSKLHFRHKEPELSARILRQTTLTYFALPQ